MEVVKIQIGSIFRWKKGVCLQAIEQSAFHLPGALFEEGTRIGDLVEISDDSAVILPMEEKPEDGRYPSVAVLLRRGVKMKLNKNCEVILLPIEGERKQEKNFFVIEP